jgi:hypothetical protein
VNIINTLPAPVVQMGYVEKIVEMQQNLPSMQQAAVGEAAVRALDKARETIEAGAETEHAARVRERDAGRDGGRRQTPDGEAEGRGAPEDGGGGAKSGRPWSGCLLDITI